jgi:membrane protein DedA with SNARE-associated domain
VIAEEAVVRWGYVVVLLWTFVEGETVLLMAGYAAQRGWLRLDLVIAAAFAGSLAGDQLLFLAGRRWGRRILASRPRWRGRVDRVHALLERRRDLFIAGFRFLYGLRTVSPLVLGTGTVPGARFLVLNALGAALWAVSFGLAGYLFGSGMEALLRDARRFEILGLAVLGAAGIAAWILRRVRAG